MAHEVVQPLSFGVTDAARYVGMSRTRLYELIGSGDLRSLRVGGRRLILRTDLEAFIARHLEAA